MGSVSLGTSKYRSVTFLFWNEEELIEYGFNLLLLKKEFCLFSAHFADKQHNLRNVTFCLENEGKAA